MSEYKKSRPELNIFTPRMKRKERMAAAPQPAAAPVLAANPAAASGNPPHLLIATPCYGSMLHTGYFNSIIQLTKVLNQVGIQYEISTIGNESLITRARNYFCSVLLANKHYTHLLFIDADITFDPMSVVRMIQFNHPVVAGAYPKKAVHWNRIPELIADQMKRTGNVDVGKLEAQAYDYAINVITKMPENAPKEANGESRITIPIVNGFLKVSYAATGFLMIQRDVVEKLAAKHPELKYRNDISGYDQGNNSECFYGLFDCFICPESRRYLSEDYAFCQLWLSEGGEIWLDLACDLTHAGTYHFRGSFRRMVENNMEVAGGAGGQQATPFPVKAMESGGGTVGGRPLQV